LFTVYTKKEKPLPCRSFYSPFFQLLEPFSSLKWSINVYDLCSPKSNVVVEKKRLANKKLQTTIFLKNSAPAKSKGDPQSAIVASWKPHFSLSACYTNLMIIN
jgi:hypothetical protein